MEVLTPEELAKRWRVSAMTVYRLIQSGELHGFKVGKLWRVTEDEVDKFEKGE